MASADQPGGMIVLRAGLAEAEAVAADSGCVIANDNGPAQVVLSGTVEAVETASRIAASSGIAARPLDVAGAFHSPLMAAAAEAFAESLDAVSFRAPSAPVLSCVTGRPFVDPKRQLVEALTARVRFRDVVSTMRTSGVTDVLDVGPGQVLAGLVRRTEPSLRKVLVNDVFVA